MDKMKISVGSVMKIVLTTYCLEWTLCFGEMDTSQPWIWNKGCRKVTGASSTKNITNNGPSLCFRACPQNTTVIALQGEVCDCRQELNVNFHDFHYHHKCDPAPCAGNNMHVCGDVAEDTWSLYEKAAPEELSRHGIPPDATGCLKVISHGIKSPEYGVEQCNQTLFELCFKEASRVCQPESETSSWAEASSSPCQVQSFKTFEEHCKEKFTQRNRDQAFWIGLFRSPTQQTTPLTTIIPSTIKTTNASTIKTSLSSKQPIATTRPREPNPPMAVTQSKELDPPVAVTSAKEPDPPVAVTPPKEPDLPMAVTQSKELNPTVAVTSTKEPDPPMAVTPPKEPDPPTAVTSAKEPDPPMAVTPPKEKAPSMVVTPSKEQDPPMTVTSAKESATPTKNNSSKKPNTSKPAALYGLHSLQQRGSVNFSESDLNAYIIALVASIGVLVIIMNVLLTLIYRHLRRRESQRRKRTTIFTDDVRVSGDDIDNCSLVSNQRLVMPRSMNGRVDERPSFLHSGRTATGRTTALSNTYTDGVLM